MRQTSIFVLGMHRSGTSALGGILEYLGVSMGKTQVKANFDNPKGFFENEKITFFNELTILPMVESTYDDTMPLHIDFHKINCMNEANKIILTEYQSIDFFGIKDPRMCLLFPFWENVLTKQNIDIKIILPYRNPLEVASSLNKRNEFSLEKGLLLWARHILYAEYHSRGHKRVFTTYENLLQNTLKTLHKIEKTLDFHFPISPDTIADQLTSFLEKDLKHHKSTLEDLPAGLPPFITETAQAYIQLANDYIPDDIEIMNKFDVWRNQYEAYTMLFYNPDFTKKLIQTTPSQPSFEIQLFLDHRNGFSEENSIKLPVTYSTDVQEFVFDLSFRPTLTNLRLDPLNDSCVIEIEKCILMTDQGEIDLREHIASNALIHHNNTYFFDHNDPQIYFNDLYLDQLDTKNLTVRIRFIHIGNDALRVCLNQIVVDKNHVIALKNSELDQTKTELDQTKTELEQILLSYSWKIMKPLRKIKQLFKGN